jgi:hypothetical protein
MTSDPKVTKVFYELKLSKNLRLNFELELGLLGFGPGLENLDIWCLLIVVFEYFSELIVDFEIAGRDNLEDGITIVFEVKNFIEGFVFSLRVSKTFGSKEATTISRWFKALDEDSLTVLEISLALLLRHYYL